LKTLPGNGADPLKKAIELLTKSMKAIYWIDPTHVLCKTSPGGDSLVFDKERDAVYQLMKITTRDSRYAAVRNVIFEIVAVDRNLAVTLINEAPAGSEKTTALKELALGDSYASKGKYKDAVEHYKKAWQHAEKVAPSCVGLHTILTGDVIGEETSGQGLFCRLFGWC
jgi:tetratricopeptide (TPR) repeat protein